MKPIRSLIFSLLMTLAVLPAMAQGEVIIHVRPKSDPLPPFAGAYLANPEQFFNVSLTNPLDEPIDVFLGLKLEQTRALDGVPSINIYTSTDVHPTSTQHVVRILPSTTKMLRPDELRNLFGIYKNESYVEGLSGVINDLQNNAVGLLPEGHYKLTMAAYRTDNNSIVSNPDISYCEFDIRYRVQPAQITSMGSGLPQDKVVEEPWFGQFEDNTVFEVNLNENFNRVQWTQVAFNDIAAKPKVKYTVELWRLDNIGDNFSLDQMPTQLPGNKVFTASAESNLTYNIQPIQKGLVLPGKYYALRVVSKPQITNSTNEGFLIVQNDGASQWRIVYNNGDIDGDTDNFYDGYVSEKEDEKTDDWKISLGYPKLKDPDNEGNGFTVRMIKGGDKTIKWEAPTKEGFNQQNPQNEKLFDKLKYKYNFSIYRIPKGMTDLDTIRAKYTPIYQKKDINGLEHKLEWKNIRDSLEINKTYLMVVDPIIQGSDFKSGEVCWTKAGVNVFSFGYYLTAAEAFKGCNEGDKFEEGKEKGYHWKSIPDEIKKGDEYKGFTCGNVDKRQAFDLVLTGGTKRTNGPAKDMKEGIASKFTGEGYIIWTPDVLGRTLTVKVWVTLKDVEFNKDGQMVAGTIKSKEREKDDWIPYGLMDAAKMKMTGYKLTSTDIEGNEEETTITAETFEKKKSEGDGWAMSTLKETWGDIGTGLEKAFKEANNTQKYAGMVGKYYDTVMSDLKGLSDICSLSDLAFTGSTSVPVTLPIRVPEILTEKIKTDISLMKMEFTPIGASMSAMLLFNMPGQQKGDLSKIDQQVDTTFIKTFKDKYPHMKDDEIIKAYKEATIETYKDIYGDETGKEKYYYDNGWQYSRILAFTITDMCMRPYSLFAESGTAALAYDMEVNDCKSYYNFKFVAPEKPDEVNSLDAMSGCALHWDTSGPEFHFALGMKGEFTVPHLLPKDGDDPVKCAFGFVTDDWDDFTAALHMDAFRVPECPDFVFYPGENVIWDHSVKHNAKGVKFPKTNNGIEGYDWSKYKTASGAVYPKQMDEAPIEWQGLYISKLAVEFPCELKQYSSDVDVYEESKYNSDLKPYIEAVQNGTVPDKYKQTEDTKKSTDSSNSSDSDKSSDSSESTDSTDSSDSDKSSGSDKSSDSSDSNKWSDSKPIEKYSTDQGDSIEDLIKNAGEYKVQEMEAEKVAIEQADAALAEAKKAWEAADSACVSPYVSNYDEMMYKAAYAYLAYEKAQAHRDSLTRKDTPKIDKNCLGAAVEDVIFDNTGITLCGKVTNIMDLKHSYTDIMGWQLTIDDVHVQVTQSDFRGCGFSGRVGVPLLKGLFKYDCDISLQKKAVLDETVDMYSERTDMTDYGQNKRLTHLTFRTQPCDTKLTTSFLPGLITFDKNGAWIKINHLPGFGTDIEMLCSGRISINSMEDSPVDFNLPGVRFVGMRVANFSVSSTGTLKGANGKKKDDYAKTFADQWVKDNKTEVENMANSIANKIVFEDRDKDNWGERMAQALRDREVKIEGKGKDGKSTKTYLNIGDWSFASPEKSFFGCSFSIKDIKPEVETKTTLSGDSLAKDEVVVKISIEGGINLLKKASTTTTTTTYDKNLNVTSTTSSTDAATQSKDDIAKLAENDKLESSTSTKDADGNRTTTTTTIDPCGELYTGVKFALRTKIKYDFNKKPWNWNWDWDGVEFESLKVNGSFGGKVKVTGELEIHAQGKNKGFNGNIEASFMGIKAFFGGGYYKMNKTDEEFKNSQWDTYVPDKIWGLKLQETTESTSTSESESTTETFTVSHGVMGVTDLSALTTTGTSDPHANTALIESRPSGTATSFSVMAPDMRALSDDERIENFTAMSDTIMGKVQEALEENMGWIENVNREKRVRQTYNAFYFNGGVITDKGIPIVGTGVKITSIMGGFYWNYSIPSADATDYEKFCKQLREDVTPKFGGVAFAMGLGLSWGEGPASINGKFSLLAAYNKETSRISTFKLLGNVKALNESIDAKASICYEEKNNPDSKDFARNFDVLVTIDAKADMTDQLKDFVGGSEFLTKYVNKIKSEDNCKGELTNLASGEKDKDKSGEDKKDDKKGDDKGEGASTKDTASDDKAKKDGEDAAKKAGENGFKANMSAHVSLSIGIHAFPNDPTKRDEFYLYVGEPEMEKRCSVTLLDVNVGKKDWKIWAKAYANAYLCIGTKLPGDGGLPDLPEKLKKFLEEDVKGQTETGTKNLDNNNISKDGTNGRLWELEQKRNAVSDAMSRGGIKGEQCLGGVAFGMSAGLDFGCRFGIGYVEMGGLLGFDLSLSKQCGPCVDEKGRLGYIGGMGGVYAQGQAYAYIYGKAGLIINLGFWSGDVDLVAMELGAVLKAGFPNPTWAYGKIKVKGSLFHGLIKFNKKVEMKVGQVCMPTAGNPLDNIDIFSESSIGFDTEGEAESEPISVTAPFTFTTNMAIGQQLDILDEDMYQAKMGNRDGFDSNGNQNQLSKDMMAQSMRAFKFYIKSNAWMDYRDMDNNLRNVYPVIQQGAVPTNHTVLSGVFEPNAQYQVTLKGYCKELVIEDGRQVEVDPYIRKLEEDWAGRMPWGQEKKLYFNTKPYSDDMAEAAMLVWPHDYNTSSYDIKHPFVSLAYPSPSFGEEGVEVLGDLERIVTETVGGQEVEFYELPDQFYSSDGTHTRVSTSKSAYQAIPFRQLVEEGTDEYGREYKYITVMPKFPSMVEKLELKQGERYRWVLYEMDVAKYDKLRGGVKETYKKIKGGDTSAIMDAMANSDIQQYIADNPDSNFAAMLKDMASDATDTSVSEMETRINTLLVNAHEASSGFRNDILNWDFVYYDDLTFAQRVKRNDTGKHFRYSPKRKLIGKNGFSKIITAGGLWIQHNKVELYDNSQSKVINPYHALWYWYNDAMYPVENTQFTANHIYQDYTPASGPNKHATGNPDWYLPLNSKNYLENCERLKFHFVAGYRPRQSAYHLYTDEITDKSQDLRLQVDNLNTEWGIRTHDDFQKLYMPGTDQRWDLIPAKWSQVDKENDINLPNWSYITSVYYSYIEDCDIVKGLEERMSDIFEDIFRMHEKGYTPATVDAMSVTNNYFTDRNKGVNCRYVNLLKDSHNGLVERIQPGNNYANNDDDIYGSSSYIQFPAWQVGAIYFQEKSKLANRHNLNIPLRYNNGTVTSWITPVKYYTTAYDMYVDKGMTDYANSLDPNKIEENVYGTTANYAYSGDGAVDILYGTPGAKAFDYDAAVGNFKSATVTLMRPDRYNARVVETLADLDNWNQYTVSEGNRSQRLLSYTMSYDHNVKATGALDNIVDDGVQFADPVFRQVIVKQVGKNVISAADLQAIKKFEYNSDISGDIKNLEDLDKLSNLETFTWNRPLAMPEAVFYGCPKLTTINVYNAPTINIDFTSTPGLRNLTLRGVSTSFDTPNGGAPYGMAQNVSSRKFVNLMKLEEIDLNSCLDLRRLTINYTTLKKFDIRDCVQLDSINLEYNMLASGDITNVWSNLNGKVKSIELPKWLGKYQITVKQDGMMYEETYTVDYPLVSINDKVTVNTIVGQDIRSTLLDFTGQHGVIPYVGFQLSPFGEIKECPLYNGGAAMDKFESTGLSLWGGQFVDVATFDKEFEQVARSQGAGQHGRVDWDVTTASGGLTVFKQDRLKEIMDNWRLRSILNITSDASDVFGASAGKKGEKLLDENLRIALLAQYGRDVQNIDPQRYPDPLTLNYWTYRKVMNDEDYKAITDLDISGYGIKSLDQLEIWCPNIEKLNCSGNEIAKLDLSNYRKLKEIDCSDNELRSVKLSLTNAPITKVVCSKNQISELDLTMLPKLRYLDCARNNIMMLNMSNVPDLWYLDCGNNSLGDLDLRKVPKLEYLDVSLNNFSSASTPTGVSLVMDLTSKNTTLKHLYMGYACRRGTWESLDLSKYEGLEVIEVNGNAQLKNLKLKINNSLTELNISNTQIATVKVVQWDGDVVDLLYGKAGNGFPWLEKFHAENTAYGAGFPEKSIYINYKGSGGLKDVNLYNSKIDMAYICANPTNGPFERLYLGQAFRNERRVAVVFDKSLESTLTWWDQNQKPDVKNRNTFGYIASAIDPAELEREMVRNLITENTAKIIESLGQAQYDKLRAELGVTDELIPEEKLTLVTTLDCRETGPMINYTFLNKLMPGVRNIMLKQHVFDEEGFIWDTPLNRLEIVNDSTKMTLPVKIPQVAPGTCYLTLKGFKLKPTHADQTQFERMIGPFHYVTLDDCSDFCPDGHFDATYLTYPYSINELVMENCDLKTFRVANMPYIKKLSLVGNDLDYVLIHPSARTYELSLMELGDNPENPDFTFRFDNGDVAVAYTSYVDGLYPGIRQYIDLKFAGSRRALCLIPYGFHTTDIAEFMKQLAARTNADYQLYEYTKEDNEANRLIRKMYPTKDKYLAEWKNTNDKTLTTYHMNPDGIHIEELRTIKKFNGDGLGLTDVYNQLQDYLYLLENLSLKNGGVDTTSTVVRCVDYLYLQNNPKLKEIKFHEISSKIGMEVNATGCPLSGKSVYNLAAYYKKVYATVGDDVKEVETFWNSRCNYLVLSGKALKKVKINSKGMSYINLTSEADHCDIYLGNLPVGYLSFILDDNDRYTLHLSNIDDVKRWMNTFMPSHPNVKCMYNDAVVDSSFDPETYDLFVKLFGTDFVNKMKQTSQLILHEGDKVTNSQLAAMLPELADSPINIISYRDGLDVKTLSIPAGDYSIQRMTISGNPTLQDINIECTVKDDSYTGPWIAVRKCDNLVSIGNICKKFQKVEVQECISLTGTLTVNAKDKVDYLDVSNNALSRINVKKAIKTLICTDNVSGIYIQLNNLPTTMEMDDDKSNTVVLPNVTLAKTWVEKHGAKHPSVIVKYTDSRGRIATLTR